MNLLLTFVGGVPLVATTAAMLAGRERIISRILGLKSFEPLEKAIARSTEGKINWTGINWYVFSDLRQAFERNTSYPYDNKFIEDAMGDLYLLEGVHPETHSEDLLTLRCDSEESALKAVESIQDFMKSELSYKNDANWGIKRTYKLFRCDRLAPKELRKGNVILSSGEGWVVKLTFLNWILVEVVEPSKTTL